MWIYFCVFVCVRILGQYVQYLSISHLCHLENIYVALSCFFSPRLHFHVQLQYKMCHRLLLPSVLCLLVQCTLFMYTACACCTFYCPLSLANCRFTGGSTCRCIQSKRNCSIFIFDVQIKVLA